MKLLRSHDALVYLINMVGGRVNVPVYVHECLLAYFLRLMPSCTDRF
jgi:hypothetical protein